MGKVAASFAKKIYVTSDNPRYEDPDAIIDDILRGIEGHDRVVVDPNRKAAIRRALDEREGDEVVLILGKGDETYQQIYDERLPFDDREVVREFLQRT
jgi:UDP-N-acetylmuramoyl-L-alanyl-D-glutamate--2,6-diaminopimelate ligase